LHKVETDSEEEAEKSNKVKALHKILRPFLLRRVKTDIEKNLLPGTFSFSVPILGGH
jgi:SWI/SNF-related matrix-associated actin-dependent regulator of chromatin subfamily A member 5